MTSPFASQVKRLDFDETFASVARLESIHILHAYATHLGFNIYQMDIKSAFFNDLRKKEVYVEQPPDFKSEEYPNHVYELHKVLYGLKQAPRAWYECLKDFLIENGFRIGKTNLTLFTRKMGKDLFVCKIYADDIIFAFTNKSFRDQFRFKISMMRVITFFLGFQIKQVKDGTFISQTKYTRDILKKFGMDKVKPIKTPMDTNDHLDLDLGGTSVDQKVYHSMIGSLFYLCASRLDIMLSVCMCARFQAAPKGCHLRAVKRIMMFLVLTPNLGICYPKGLILSSLDIRMPIMPDAKWIERVPLRLVNSLDGPLSLGLRRNKIPLPYPRPKRSMSPPVVIVHN
jgi:hypothetical protein